jgi:hypothetical protein
MVDSTRRSLLTTGAAAVAAATAPRAFAQSAGKGNTAQPFYQRGDVRIRYQEAGAGFPLLIIPGGGQNSTIAWANNIALFNAAAELGNEYRCKVSLYPRKDTKDKIPLAVRQVRTFLRAHRPATA